MQSNPPHPQSLNTENSPHYPFPDSEDSRALKTKQSDTSGYNNLAEYEGSEFNGRFREQEISYVEQLSISSGHLRRNTALSGIVWSAVLKDFSLMAQEIAGTDLTSENLSAKSTISADATEILHNLVQPSSNASSSYNYSTTVCSSISGNVTKGKDPIHSQRRSRSFSNLNRVVKVSPSAIDANEVSFSSGNTRLRYGSREFGSGRKYHGTVDGDFAIFLEKSSAYMSRMKIDMDQQVAKPSFPLPGPLSSTPGFHRYNDLLEDSVSPVSSRLTIATISGTNGKGISRQVLALLMYIPLLTLLQISLPAFKSFFRSRS